MFTERRGNTATTEAHLSDSNRLVDGTDTVRGDEQQARGDQQSSTDGIPD